MIPQRVAAKFFISPDPTDDIELHPFIGLFHRFIQEHRVEGLLIDVADYAHVPDGPGVLLVGHDVDYGLDLTAGRAGLLTTRKRYEGLALGEVVRDTLRKALLAVQAIEDDGAAGVRFATDAVEIAFVDRLATPNTEEALAAVRAEVEPVVEKLFGAGYEIRRIHRDDARQSLALSVTATETVAAAALAERLG